MKSIYLIILLFIPFYSFGDNGIITGIVKDASNGEAVDFAVVNILTADSVSIKNDMTNNGGKFQFTGLPYGTYSVKITFIGYRVKVYHKITLNAAKPAADLGIIKLEQDNQQLAEVVITDTKPEVEYDADKITYNVSQGIMAEGASASDILRNVPSLSVDIDGNATIAGKRSTRIFIDGKPSDYTSAAMADLLSVLPSESIEKIEVLDNPPARYSSDGEGIINIVLKKGYKIGLNGSISASAGTKGTYNSNGYVSYKGDKLSLNSSFGGRFSENFSEGYAFRHNFFPDTTFYVNQFNSGSSSSTGGNFRTGGDWDISKKQNLRFSGSLNFNNSRGDSGSDNHYLDNNQDEHRTRVQQNNNHSDHLNYRLNADYELKIDSSRQLSIGLNYNGESSSRYRDFSRNYFRTADETPITDPTLQRNDNNINGSGLSLKADYTKSFKNRRGSFETGVEAQLQTNDNDQLAENFDFDLEQYQLNENLTNRFMFYENIYSAYTSLRIRTENLWSFRAGGRAEITDVTLKQNSTGGVDIEPYINFFPSFSISKNIKRKYTIGASYSMRINRPREYALNPLIDDSDPANIRFGNPGLKPSFTHQYSLNFSTYGNNWSVSPRLSYSSASGIIERMRTVDTQGNSQTTYENLASSQSFNFSIYSNYRVSRRTNFNLSSSLGRVIYESEGSSRVNRSGVSFRSNAGLSLMLPQKISVEGYLNYYNNSSAQGRYKGYLQSNFGARKSFLNNKLYVRLMASDPFSNRNQQVITEGENFKAESMRKIYTRNFSLTLSYRFTKVNSRS